MKKEELVFDSESEKLFFDWANELKSAGLIESIKCQPAFNILEDKFIPINRLKTRKKTHVVEKHKILNGLIYTADFRIVWNEKLLNILFQPMDNLWNKPSTFYTQFNKDGKYESYIEVKETNMHGNIARFSVVQRILYHTTGIYINPIKMFLGRGALFKNTFQPETLDLMIKTGKRRRKQFEKWDEKRINEYLKEIL